MQRCTCCLQEKSLSEFYSNKTKPNGYEKQCKICIKKKSSERYSKTPIAIAEAKKREEKLDAMRRGVKYCEKCEIEKNRSCFSKLAKAIDGLSVYCKECTREYYKNNSEIIKSRVKKYAQDNAEIVKKRSFEYRQAHQEALRRKARLYYVANSQKICAYQAEYRNANSEKVRADKLDWYSKNRIALLKKAQQYRINNLEALNLRKKQWCKKNTHLINAASKRHKAAKLRAVPKWANHTKIAEFYASAQELNMLLGEWHHVDHIVPLQSSLVCGLHCEANLQILPWRENVIKNNRYWPDMP